MPFVVLILCVMLGYIVAFLLTDDACLLFSVLSGLFLLSMISHAILAVI